VTATARAVGLVEIAAAAAADKLATDIIAYDVTEQLVITDAFLLCSAANDRQVKAVVDEIEAKLQQQAGLSPARREGEREGRWVLLDYIDVVIHVQHAEERVFYAMERLWKDCPLIPLPEAAGAGAQGRPSGAGPGSGSGSGPRVGGGLSGRGPR
jgi:ribosome-associated protein